MAMIFPPPEEPTSEDEKAPVEIPVPEEQALPETPEPGIDIPQGPSRFSRFMRSLLRWALLIVLLFGAGMLTTYFTLVRPLQQQAAASQSSLDQARQDLSSAETRLGESEGQVKNMQTQVEQAQTNVEKAQNKAALQTVRTDLALTRLALANKDGPAARTSLVQAQNDLAQLLPTLEKSDASLAKSITGRLEIILNELNRDPTTAISDLDILSRHLDEAEEALGLK